MSECHHCGTAGGNHAPTCAFVVLGRRRVELPKLDQLEHELRQRQVCRLEIDVDPDGGVEVVAHFERTIEEEYGPEEFDASSLEEAWHQLLALPVVRS